MEQLQIDRMRLDEDHQEQQTFLDAVGYRVNGSFLDPKTIESSQSTTQISLGGLIEIKQGSALQVAFRQDNVLLDVRRSLVCFEVEPTVGFLKNGVALFQPTSATLGSKSWNYARGELLNQQRICQYDHNEASMIQDGVGICAFPSKFFEEAFDETGGSQMLASHNDERVQVIGRTVGTKQKYAIPICEIWPFLLEFEKIGGVYIGLGQSLVMNALLNSPTRCMLYKYKGPGTLDYSVSGFTLVSVYTKLDSNLLGNIMRSQIPFLSSSFLYNSSPAGATQVLNYNITKKQRVKGINIAFHWNKARITGNNEGQYTKANEMKLFEQDIVNNSLSTYKSDICYFPDLSNCITSIVVSFGGIQRTWNAQAIQWLLRSKYMIKGKIPYLADNPLSLFKNSVLYLPFERFSEDAFGASSGQNLVMQVQIQLDPTLGAILGQAPGVQIINFDVHGFLEVVEEGICENGIYK